jgi:hypothetical protein
LFNELYDIWIAACGLWVEIQKGRQREELKNEKEIVLAFWFTKNELVAALHF